MRTYHFARNYDKLLTPDIVSLLTQTHEYKGEQALLIKAKADALTKLAETAKIQSAGASNRIEGIYTTDERLKKLVQDKTTPRTRKEQEIAGYRDVLAVIQESFDYIPPTPSGILQLHRDLYKFSSLSYGGHYKTSDNVIAGTGAQGNKRFQPVPVRGIAEAVKALCAAYQEAVGSGEMDPLLLIPMFILDFLCIHPFSDGNGRINRLLTLLLLCRAGYIVGKYISIEKLIEESKETYYEVLQQSAQGWHEGENDYAPFARYTLGVVAAAYREFSARVRTLAVSGMSKPDRVREIIKGALGKLTKAEILEQCPDISAITVQRTLADLQKSGEVIKLCGGRYTAYTWNRERE